MSEVYHSIPLTRMARTVADILAVPAPKGASEGIAMAEKKMAAIFGGNAQRAVLYHADAIGSYLVERYTERFAPVFEHADIGIPMISTVMSLTPVAHASMYTGLEPAQHGIRVYERPRLTCETLFDTLLAAGKRPAIIAMTDSTFMHIISGRDMPYYEVRTNAESLEKAKELMRTDACDVLSIHTFEYDDAAHEEGPESPRALDAAQREAEGFARVTELVKRYWSAFDTLTAYLPDHGQHAVEPWEPNEHGYKGDHGSFRTEDMNVFQFYGAIPAAKRQL